MRIAVTGSHATGKSSLVAELVREIAGLTAIDEPYYLLEDEGHVLNTPPTCEDFGLLLERSLALIASRPARHVVYDRSPADYLAYLAVCCRDRVPRESVADVAAALASLDLVIFVPIEHPDRVEGAEAPRLRRRVDAVLAEMLVDDGWGFGVPILVVQGTLRERAEQVRVRLLSMQPRAALAQG